LDLSALRGLQSDNISDSDLSDIRGDGEERGKLDHRYRKRLDANKFFMAGRVFTMLWHEFAGVKRACTVVFGEWSLSGNVMDIVGAPQSVPTTTKVSHRRISVLRTEKPTVSSTWTIQTLLSTQKRRVL
jgi:hypothetical protein